MNLSPDIEKRYTQEQLSAKEAQRLAQEIAFAPVAFQLSRLMLKFGILQLLNEHPQGLTQPEIVSLSNRSPYAIQVLLEASLYRYCSCTRG